MRKYAELNAIAIYRKMRFDQPHVKKFTGGHPVSNNGLLVRSSVSEPVYSYVKNYEKFGKEFSLFVWTDSADEEAVVSQLDKAAKTLKREQIMQIINKVKSFEYLEQKLEVK